MLVVYTEAEKPGEKNPGRKTWGEKNLGTGWTEPLC
jgi:hypothetical protein